jgi:hypothetical protein
VSSSTKGLQHNIDVPLSERVWAIGAWCQNCNTTAIHISDHEFGKMRGERGISWLVIVSSVPTRVSTSRCTVLFIMFRKRELINDYPRHHGYFFLVANACSLSHQSQHHRNDTHTVYKSTMRMTMRDHLLKDCHLPDDKFISVVIAT